jgi:deoxyribodipyrimidine photo-lyase
VTIAIWWVRRDLRLTDNQALSAALAHVEQITPVFVLDPILLTDNTAACGSVAEKRLAFLFEGLRALDESLRARGSRLVIRRGDPRDELAALLTETGAEAIYAEADVWPYGAQRDARVAKELPLHLTGGLTVHPPEAVLKADGTPYVVFTPYSRRWKALTPPEPRDVLPAPERIATPRGVASLSIPPEPALPSGVPFPPGEVEAHRRLDAFLSGDDPPVYRYAETRDRMDLDGTSCLSPYLRFGMLSARQTAAMAGPARERAPDEEARRGVETWLNELIWREFYQAILHHFPHVLERSFRSNLQAIPWDNDQAAFASWCEGRTGYPVVDAAMRQLTHTGWMHNRARMIVASFLVKDLLVDWHWGERFFMQRLVDGDPAANNGGWQWTAGTGTDAAPYFRIFNPVAQGKKYDPQGDYVRRWISELAEVPDRFIHEPWKMPVQTQQSVGCVIGQNYSNPIVDHARARERALAAYAKAKQDPPIEQDVKRE